jgi:hypothetical protein
VIVIVLSAAVKAIAAAQGSSGVEGLKVVEKAKAAVSSIKVGAAEDPAPLGVLAVATSCCNCLQKAATCMGFYAMQDAWPAASHQ